jgi:phosphotriesterase-related protein
MKGKVQTVLGPIDAKDLGITLPHEHLLVDCSFGFLEPEEDLLRRVAHQEVSLENLSLLQYNACNNLDNLQLRDVETITEELESFKREGGNSVVCLSNVGLGRNPLGLVRVSQATRLNVIMGCGYYVREAQSPDYEQKTREEITEEIIADVEVGVGNTGVRAGIIGELGCSWPLAESEHKVLVASAVAQKQTGVAISIHQLCADQNQPMHIIKILDRAGADISRVIIGHVDYSILSLDTRLALAKTGCYLEYDLFGSNHISHIGSIKLKGPEIVNRPCDRERIEQLIELIDAGYLNQILISHDIGMKIKLQRYGGHGYAHILRNIIPQMLVRGITSDQIRTMMVDNPSRVLQFA